MSLEAFLQQYPSGKIPRQSPDFGKTFVCRRGCNTRTASYTDEFIWEELLHSRGDVFKLIELVKQGTKATRRKRRARSQSPQDGAYHPETPTKTGRGASATTPQSKRALTTPGSRKK